MQREGHSPERSNIVKKRFLSLNIHLSKLVSDYDQEIPQSQTADKPMAQTCFTFSLNSSSVYRYKYNA